MGRSPPQGVKWRDEVRPTVVMQIRSCGGSWRRPDSDFLRLWKPLQHLERFPDLYEHRWLRRAITVFIAHYSLPKIIQLETSRDHRRRQSADSSRVASALEFVLADNTKRVHAGQWRLFNETSGGRSTGVGPSFPAPGSRKREGQPDIAPALTAAPEGWVLRRSAR